MKCVSCEKEINPQWSHAIELNACPFCGDVIMDEALKDLLSSLKDVMTSLVQFPVELNDWLFSNHSFIKTDSPDLWKFISKETLDDLLKNRRNEVFDEKKNGTKKVVKVKNEQGEDEEVLTEVIQDKKVTNDFFKRAQATSSNDSPEEKTSRLKAMVEKIKAGSYEGASNPAMLSEREREESYVIDGNGEEIHSAIESPMDDFDKIPSTVLQMAREATPKMDAESLMQSDTYNKKDHAALQRMALKQNEARANAFSGKGKFSR